MDDEMLMEETLDNLGRTSTQVLHMEAFDMSLPMYGYVVFSAAFEPLQRRSAGFHRPDIVESLKCAAVLMCVFCIY